MTDNDYLNLYAKYRRVQDNLNETEERLTQTAIQLTKVNWKRYRSVLKALYSRAISERDWWDNFMHYCPEYRHKYFDRLHNQQYCRSYKGKTAEEWFEYWNRWVERLFTYRRKFYEAEKRNPFAFH